MSGLRGERCGSRSGESLRQTREHHEVGVEHDPLQASDAKRSQAVLVLEPPELALDRTAPTIEVAPARSVTRDRKVQGKCRCSVLCAHTHCSWGKLACKGGSR